MRGSLLRRPKGLPYRPRVLLAGALAAFLASLGLHGVTGGARSARSSLDTPFHDAVVAAKPRQQWRHVALVSLDLEGLPVSWSRIQLNPLYFQAAKALVRAGARGVTVDARLTENPPDGIPYFQCIESPRSPRIVRSMLEAVASDSGVASSVVVSRPLEDAACGSSANMDSCEAVQMSMASALGSDWAGTRVRHADKPLDIPLLEDGTLRLAPVHDQSIVGWAMRGERRFLSWSLSPCATGYAPDGRCFEIRRSASLARGPVQGLMDLPLTELASCDTAKAIAYARSHGIAGRWALIEPLPLEESGDRHYVVSSFFDKQDAQMSGTRILADAIETGLRGDAPWFLGRWWIVGLLCLLGVGSGVWAGLNLRMGAAMSLSVLFGLALFAIMLPGPWILLLPVACPVLSFLGGVAVAALALVAGGAREAELTAKYIPKPVYDLVLRGGGPDKLRNRRIDVAVLMTDIRNYTTITSRLGSAEAVLSLLNTYYDGIAGVALDRHHGWFEGYVGDMMCCYWPCLEGMRPEDVREQALRAALAVRNWQKKFFVALAEGRVEVPHVPLENLPEIAALMGAGIGLSWGEVVMGHLGQKGGLSKFGIIGDPLNTASRIEGLTKGFDADLLATPEFVETAHACGFSSRRFALVRVKGRPDPVPLLGIDQVSPTDWDQEHWDAWLARVEAQGAEEPLGTCGATLLSWREKGYLHEGVWALDEK